MKILAMRLLLIVALLLLVLGSTLAQEGTEEAPIPAPTLEVVTTAPVVEAPAPEASAPASSFFDESTMLIASSILLAIIVGGAFFLAIKSLEALKVSVPQETITAIGTQLISIMTSQMASAKKRAEETDTPMDDLLLAIARVPNDYLIAEIQKRVLTDEHRANLGTVVKPPEATNPF